ncbi:hypothetical protein CR513_21332, partial [Mucuna pruriens]
MKNIFVACVLLFALTSQPLLGAAEAAPEPVIDTSGKKLQSDLSYYIVPAVRSFTRCGRYECLNAEGLSLASIGESCPLDVVLVQRSHGLPLTFAPVDPKKGVVRVSTDLNIMFSTDRTSCAEYSPVWKLDHFDATRLGKPFATSSRLRNVMVLIKHMCKDVGVFVDENGYRRLALSDVPYKVKFQMA